MKRIILYFLSLIGLAFSMDSKTSENFKMIVGCYNEANQPGLFSFDFNQTTGRFQLLDSLVLDNPSYFTMSKNGDKIFCISENAVDNSTASTIAFSPETSKFELINSLPLTGSPCYIDNTESLIATANYGGGSLDLISIDKSGLIKEIITTFEGSTGGPDNVRQNLPHIHCAKFSIDGTKLYATDFSSDRLLCFNLDLSSDTILGEPTVLQLPSDTGCRHIVFSPNDKFAYVLGELSGKINVINIENNEFSLIQTIEADAVHERASADVHLSPDGRFLYASNRRKNDGLAIFSVDADNGKLNYVGYQPTGMHPRNFTISPNGQYVLVACRDSNIIEIYERDPHTGFLTLVDKNIELQKPVCIKFIVD